MREKQGGSSGKRRLVSSEIKVDREREQRRDGKAGTRMWTGKGDAEVSGVAETERGAKRKAADDRGPKQRRVPRYLQRSSRTLPGISTRLVSMMRTHSRSSASRLRAAGDRGYCRKTPENTQRRR